ncbi:MAG: hypothetical protein ACI9JE_001186 [Candidatus Krumholzibacteriia bacterium]|jgi:hypothetical protein
MHTAVAVPSHPIGQIEHCYWWRVGGLGSVVTTPFHSVYSIPKMFWVTYINWQGFGPDGSPLAMVLRSLKGIAIVGRLHIPMSIVVIALMLAGCSDENPLRPVKPDTTLSTISGDVYLTSQTDVDELRGVNVVSGNLYIRGLSVIRNLSALSSLKFVGGSLRILECDSLRSLASLDSLRLVSGSLVIQTNELFTDLTGLDNADVIGSVHISANASLVSVQGLRHELSARSIFLSRNWSLDNLVGMPDFPLANSLIVYGAGSLSLQGMGAMPAVQNMVLSRIKDLSGLGPGDNWPALETLSIIENSELENLSELPSFSNLKRLTVANNIGLTTISMAVEMPALLDFHIEYNSDLIVIGLIGPLPVLNKLSIARNFDLESLVGFSSLPLLETLSLYSNFSLLSLEGLGALPFLSLMIVENLVGEQPLAGITDLGNLDQLDLRYITGQDLSGLPDMPVLRTLTLSDFSDLVSTAGLPSLVSLHNLYLGLSPLVTDLSGLTHLPNLGSYTLSNLLNLAEIENPLELSVSCEVRLTQLPALVSLSAFQNIEELGRLRVGSCDAIESLDGLQSLRRVTRTLTVDHCESLVDASALSGMEELSSAVVWINNNPVLDECIVNDMVVDWDCLVLTVEENGACQ